MKHGQTAMTAFSNTGYFEPESRLQLVDKVRHLIRFSDFLLLLTGVSGVGKTTLLKQIFPAATDNSVHTCLISVVDDLPLGTLLSGLLAQLPSHGDFSESDQGKLEALNEQIKVTRDHGQRLLILVDDADRLSDEALDLLINLQLAHDNDDGTAPQLLLAGQPELADRLESSRWLDALAGRYHQLPLEPFADEEIKAFILQAVPGARMMSDKDINALAKRCGGFPGRLSGETAADAKPEKKSKKQTADSVAKGIPAGEKAGATGRRAFPLPPLHMGGIALLLIGITVAAAWTFAPHEEPSVTVDEGGKRVTVPLHLSIPGKSQTAKVSELDKRLAEQEVRLKQESTAPVAAEPEPELEPEAVIAVIQETQAVDAPVEIKVAEGVADTETQADSAAAAAQPPKQKPVAQPVARPEVTQREPVAEPPVAGSRSEQENTPGSAVIPVAASRSSAETSPQVVERSAPVQKPAETVPVKSMQASDSVLTEGQVPRNARILADEKRLLAEPAGHYTLQLLGAREQSSTERFVKSYPDLDGVRVFATLFKGKPWYVVVYGSYADRKQAGAAIATLPQGLKKLRPWARSMKGVHSDIQKR